MTARRLRPISRWISTVRPPCLPAVASRRLRSSVARGSMPYSAVTQPRAWPLSQGGRRSSSVAVTSTWVSPNFTKHEPSAYLTTPRSSDMARSSSGWRRLGRITHSPGGGRGRRVVPPTPLLGAPARRDKSPTARPRLELDRLVNKYPLRYLIDDACDVSRRPDWQQRSQPCAAQRALARDFPSDRRELSCDRRAGRLAQPVAHHSDDAVAGFGAQRDAGPGAARAHLCAAHFGRPAADRTRSAVLCRCPDANRRSERQGPHRHRGPGRGCRENGRERPQ